VHGWTRLPKSRERRPTQSGISLFVPRPDNLPVQLIPFMSRCDLGSLEPSVALRARRIDTFRELDLPLPLRG